jgi:di/tricarboxylate transporter
LLETIGTLRSIQSALHGIGSPIVTMLVLSYITALLSNMDSSTLVVLGAMAPIGLAISSGSAPAVLAVLVTVATATAIISMSPVHIDGSLIIANTPNDDEPHVFRRLIYLTVAISIVIPGLLAVYPIMAGA